MSNIKRQEHLKATHSERTHQAGVEAIESTWLIPYGNMMTILMVFFLILYSYTYFSNDVNYERLVTKIQKDFAKNDKQGNVRVDKKMKETEAASSFDKYLKDKGLDKMAKVEINAQKMRILLTSPVLFKLGRAGLTDEAKHILNQVAVLLKKLPNQVVIEGHTDNIPIKTARYKSNWELSSDRAISVVNYLINEEKLPADRLAVAGYGEHQPMYPNDTRENRSRNRRIEIVILRIT